MANYGENPKLPLLKRNMMYNKKYKICCLEQFGNFKDLGVIDDTSCLCITEIHRIYSGFVYLMKNLEKFENFVSMGFLLAIWLFLF